MRWTISLALVLVAAGSAAACSSSSDSGSAVGVPSDGFGGTSSSFGGGGNGGGAGAYQGSGGSGGYNGGGGSGGSGAWGGAAGAAPRDRHNGPDAGPEAGDDAGDASTCDSLDATQPATFFLSADDSNSMASPAIARRLIQQGAQVPPSVIRTYEFLNYYNVGYPAAPYGTLSIVPEFREASDGSYELQIGVASNAAPKPRRPMQLTFVLDTSGSMGGDPINLERHVVKAIAGQLAQGDVVSAVTWNTQNAVMLDSYAVSGPNDAKIVALANSLVSGGGTNLNGGLTAGYAIAQKNFDPTKLNRVIIVSDGQANAGITDENIIGKGAALNDGDGVYLVGVGVGNGVNDTLMNTVTDAGRGAYVYVDTAAEAAKMFGPRFDEVMDVAARGVQVELQMPWYMGIEVFYGEEYSTNPVEIEPQHLAPNDAMVFNQIVRPCSDSELDLTDPLKVTARWQTPLDHSQKEVTYDTTLGALLAATPKYMDKAMAIITYAEALKDPTTAKTQLAEAKKLADVADPSNSDAELQEIRTLIEKALTVY